MFLINTKLEVLKYAGLLPCKRLVCHLASRIFSEVFGSTHSKVWWQQNTYAYAQLSSVAISFKHDCSFKKFPEIPNYVIEKH